MPCVETSTSGSYYGARLNMLSAQNQIQQATRQLDGWKAHTYAELYPQAHMLMGFETQLAKMDAFVQGHAALDLKLQTMETSLNGVYHTFQRFYGALLDERNTLNKGQGDIRARANEALIEIQAYLNVTDENGRYLFSGSQLNKPSVNLSLLPAPTLEASPSIQYYQGDHVFGQQEIREGVIVTYGITADHSALNQMIHACALAAHAPSDPQRQAYLDQALNSLQTGFQGLVGLMSQVGQQRRQVEEATQDMTLLKDSVEESFNALAGVDPAEVITRWTTLQVQLQSTLMVMQRLHQTSLVNMMS